MMKKVSIIIVLSVLTFSVRSQSLVLSDTVRVEDATTSEIITAGNLFVAQSFQSADDVIQMEDKEAGILIAKGNFDYEFSQPRFTCTSGNGKGVVHFTIKLMAKDGRFKFDIKDIEHDSNDPNVNFGLLNSEMPAFRSGAIGKCQEDIYKEIRKEINQLQTRIKEGILKEIESTDW
jgi:hypothetical protein